MRVAVVGAGAFGGWTALHLQRLGARVTLLDAWGPGNSRASSGGETRIIRTLYADRIYVELTLRSMELWRDFERRDPRGLLRRTGLLRMVGPDDPLNDRAAPLLREAGVPLESLTPAEASRRFPEVHFGGINRVFYEPGAGYLAARRGCQMICEAFQREGGEYRQLAAVPHPDLRSLSLSDGARLTADAYVFACGPWLGKLFPDVVGGLVTPQRRDVFFFGLPAGDARFGDDRFPCWWDTVAQYYGVPGNEWRGFKVGEDAGDTPFDPTDGDRAPSPEALRAAREYLGFRFPALAGAPLVESRVCQYELTPDKHLIVDRHPQAEHVLLAGGGSGHGYKLGAAIGEQIAEIVLGRRSPNPFFGLSRFTPR